MHRPTGTVRHLGEHHQPPYWGHHNTLGHEYSHFGCILSVTCRLYFMSNDPKPLQAPPSVWGNWGDAPFYTIHCCMRLIIIIVREMREMREMPIRISRNAKCQFAFRARTCRVVRIVLLTKKKSILSHPRHINTCASSSRVTCSRSAGPPIPAQTVRRSGQG